MASSISSQQAVEQRFLAKFSLDAERGMERELEVYLHGNACTSFAVQYIKFIGDQNSALKTLEGVKRGISNVDGRKMCESLPNCKRFVEEIKQMNFPICTDPTYWSKN